MNLLGADCSSEGVVCSLTQAGVEVVGSLMVEGYRALVEGDMMSRPRNQKHPQSTRIHRRCCAIHPNCRPMPCRQMMLATSRFSHPPG